MSHMAAPALVAAPALPAQVIDPQQAVTCGRASRSCRRPLPGEHPRIVSVRRAAQVPWCDHGVPVSEPVRPCPNRGRLRHLHGGPRVAGRGNHLGRHIRRPPRQRDPGTRPRTESRSSIRVGPSHPSKSVLPCSAWLEVHTSPARRRRRANGNGLEPRASRRSSSRRSRHRRQCRPGRHSCRHRSHQQPTTHRHNGQEARLSRKKGACGGRRGDVEQKQVLTPCSRTQPPGYNTTTWQAGPAGAGRMTPRI